MKKNFFSGAFKETMRKILNNFWDTPKIFGPGFHPPNGIV